jgi:hypothetical protein
MLRTYRQALGMFALALVLLSQVAALAQDPIAVITIKNADALISDLKYILAAGGSDELGDLVDNMIDQMTQGKGLAGIDRTKPLGAYMTLNAGNTADFVVFIPVTDNRVFKEDFLTSIFSRQQQVAGGMFSVQSEDGQQFYGKFANGHCFISPLAAALNKLVDPARIVQGKFTFNMDADLSRMPDEVKDGLLEQFEETVKAAEEEQAVPLSEIEARVRDRGQKIFSELARMLIKETDRLSIGIDVDQKSKLVALDIGMVPRPKSPFAQSLAAYKNTTSALASLIAPDAAASMIFAAPVSNQLRQYFMDTIQATIEQARTDIDNSEDLATNEKNAAKELMERLMTIIKSTGETTPNVDNVFAVYTLPNDMAQIVAAGNVPSGADVTKSLAEFAKHHDGTPQGDKVKVDVAQHAGAQIHRLTFDLDGESPNYFTTGTAHLAVRKNTIFFAVGGDSLEAVKTAIDRSSRQSGAVTQASHTASASASSGDRSGKASPNRPPVSLRLQPSRLLAVFGKGDDPTVKLAREAFNGDGDHISMELFSVEGGARMRLELGEGFLRFIALSVSQQLEEPMP